MAHFDLRWANSRDAYPIPPPLRNQLHPKVREFPNTLRVSGQMEGISYHIYCTKVLPIALWLASEIAEIYWEERLAVS